MSAKHRIGIRLIATATAVGITGAAVVGVATVQERNARAALTHEIEARLLLEARSLSLASSSALLAEFPELTLLPLVKEMMTDQPELAMVVVTDHRGIIQGHSDPRQIGSRWDVPADLEDADSHSVLRPSERLMASDSILVASAPVVAAAGPTIGSAAVGLRKSHIDGVLSAARNQQSLVLGIVLVIGMLTSMVLMTLLLKPIDLLKAGLNRIGSGDFDTPIRLRCRTELGMLADTVDEMASRLKTAQAETLERERLSHELDLARDIQSSLLPKAATTAGSFLIQGVNRSASEVGGDYFDILPVAGGRIGIAIADVSGKGLSGCLAMSMLSALLRAYRDSYESPSALLAQMDARLSESLQPGSFVTMFYGILDPDSGRLTFASAGHLPTMIYRAHTRSIEQYRTKGIPLGAVRGGMIRATLRDETLTLSPGDLLLQYTDGVNETFDKEGKEQFDFRRMEAVLADCAPGGCKTVLKGLCTALEAWRGNSTRSDDETILIVSREAAQPLRLVTGQDHRSDAVEVPPHAAALELADSQGVSLDLTASLEELDKIPVWLASLPRVADLEAEPMQLLATALYEVCANIVEHGYDCSDGYAFRIWWIPRSPADSRPTGGTPAPRSDPWDGIEMTAAGMFVVVDRGRPFAPHNWQASKFEDPAVRRRSRGFGLDIIYKVMARVVYTPGTQDGNVTSLVFDPSFLRLEERRLSNVG